jgi:hypothetical protein
VPLSNVGDRMPFDTVYISQGTRIFIVINVSRDLAIVTNDQTSGFFEPCV